jgi:acyloxyacyl hydrolase
VVDLVQKIAVQEAQGSVKQALDYLCGNFNAPGESALKKICDGAAVLIAIPIQAALDKKEIPDTTCQTGTLAFLKMCTPDQFTCQLFPSPVHERVQHFSLSASQDTSPLHTRSLLMSRTRAQLTMFSVLMGAKMKLPGGDIQHHRPLIDLDGDLFSPTPTLRGWHWRGRDCNDGDKTIYPGRAQNNYGPSVDHNCNGISGLDQTQRSYEEEFCGGPNAPRGTIVLGMPIDLFFFLINHCGSLIVLFVLSQVTLPLLTLVFRRRT